MKKILQLLLIITISQTVSTYVSQNGLLILGDQVQINQLTLARSIKHGLIMNTIITDPEFAQDLNKIYQYLNIPTTQQLPPYEEIVETLKISTNKAGAIDVIEAFEKAIMKQLHYNNYLFWIEGKIVNIFITGIKTNWFYPSEWINSASWLSSCNQHDIKQLLAELEQLADIASKHSILTKVRLKTKIESYRNWKINTLKTIGAVSVTGLCVALYQRLKK